MLRMSGREASIMRGGREGREREEIQYEGEGGKEERS